MATSHTLLGIGLYALPRAARLVGAEPRKVRRWLKGYAWRSGDADKSSAPLWSLQHADDQVLGDDLVLGFQDLLELRTVARFIEHGVSLRVIRATLEVARETLGAYPLHSKRFVTDGRKIFLEAVERAGEDPKLLDVRGRQFAIDAVIRPGLLDGIEFGADASAVRWFPVPKKRIVMLDPQVQFGEPVVADGGVPTEALASAFEAEGRDVARVARLYQVKPQEVRAAVDFEQRLVA